MSFLCCSKAAEAQGVGLHKPPEAGTSEGSWPDGRSVQGSTREALQFATQCGRTLATSPSSLPRHGPAARHGRQLPFLSLPQFPCSYPALLTPDHLPER